MIQPDFNLFLWTILILTTINSIAKIICGSAHVEKEAYYTYKDVFAGIIELFIIGWVVLK